MARGTQRERARELLAEHGTTFADDLGIPVAKDTPQALFRLLVATLLLSARVQHKLALQAARELHRARLSTAQRMADADERTIWRALEAGDYLRKDRTTAMLHDAADHALRRFDGDLRGLRAQADGDAGRARELLQEFKGVGPVGAELFLREVQVAWDDLRPFFGGRALGAAKRAGLPTDAGALAALVDPDDVARLAAALVRVDLREETTSQERRAR